MVARQDALSLVKGTFPGHDPSLDRAYRESESFRDLCHDYRNCARALERWRQYGPETSPRVREYVDLLAQLEREVESCLRTMSHTENEPVRSREEMTWSERNPKRGRG